MTGFDLVFSRRSIFLFFLVHPDESDDAVLDEIVNYNRLVEEHKDVKFKALYHEGILFIVKIS